MPRKPTPQLLPHPAQGVYLERNPRLDGACGDDFLTWETMQLFRAGAWENGCRPSDLVNHFHCTRCEAKLTLRLLDAWDVITRRDRDGRYFNKEEKSNAA